jgi:hypothetical protein
MTFETREDADTETETRTNKIKTGKLKPESVIFPQPSRWTTCSDCQIRYSDLDDKTKNHRQLTVVHVTFNFLIVGGGTKTVPGLDTDFNIQGD